MPRRILDNGVPPRKRVRVRVVGPRGVKHLTPGKTGELRLTDDQAAALVMAGHIEVVPDGPPTAGTPPDVGELPDGDAPETDPTAGTPPDVGELPDGDAPETDPTAGTPPDTGEPGPPPTGRKATKKPRQRAGLSHVQTPAAAADEKKE